MKTLMQRHPTAIPSTALEYDALEALIAPFVAFSSPQCIPAVHPLKTGGRSYEYPKILLLGDRGGGDPIRIAVFSGIDPDSTLTVSIAYQLLQILNENPGLARDFALFFYPIANLPGLLPGTPPFQPRALESRWQNTPRSRDAVFLREEMERLDFHGLIRLRSSTDSFFHTTTRSTLIAREVFEPALKPLGAAFQPESVTVLSASLGARRLAYTRGALAPKPVRRSGPFELDLHIPNPLPPGITPLSVAGLVPEILSLYRRFISYGGDL